MDDKKEHTWSWNISEADLQNQADNYNTLGITESYRGIAVLIYSALLTLWCVLGYFGILISLSDALYSLILYIPILYFVYRGRRWAMVLLMILWTIEKCYTAYLSVQAGTTPISS